MEELSTYDFGDTEYVPNGYDMTQVPKATPDNMLVLMRKINELVAQLNEMTIIHEE